MGFKITLINLDVQFKSKVDYSSSHYTSNRACLKFGSMQSTVKNKENISTQSDKYHGFFKKGYVNYCGIRGFFRTNKNRKKKHEEILHNFIIPDFEESIIKDSLESLKNDQGFLHPRPKYNLLNDPTAPLYYDYFFKKNHIKEYKNIKSLLDTIFSYQKKLKLEDNEGSWVG